MNSINTQTKSLTLSSLTDLAYRSYSNISQSPERRAVSIVKDYSIELDSDIEKIKSKGANSEQTERYKKEYTYKLSAWLSSQSNCASSFVCGPANFPVRKMEKRNRWAQNHYNTFRAWREKVLNAYVRYVKKEKIALAGGELEIAKKKLSNLEFMQVYMKEVNAAHKKYLKNPESLEKIKLTDSQKETIKNYIPKYSHEKHPYQPWQLTNNNATIKNTKERVSVLEKKEVAAATGNKDLTFEGGKIVLNTELDRLQIVFDVIPSDEMRTSLKKNGFKWSPFYKVWQRQLTENAKRATNYILKTNI